MAEIRTTQYVAKPRNPDFSVGKKHRVVPARAALVTASMADGDILTLAGPLTYGDRVARVLSPNVHANLTSTTNAKLGFFMRAADGTLKVIKAASDALLWNGVSLATGVAGDLLFAKNAALSSTANIGELLQQGADQEPAGGVFLGLTFVTKPSVDGVLDLDVMIEEATSV